jgi:ribosome-binding protein aMBF1 (putative translation factor)
MYCDICGARIDEYENYDYRDGVTVCESCLKCIDDVEKVL